MTRRVKTYIRLGIRSVSPSDQSPHCPHEETLGPYLPIEKSCGVSPRNVAEFLREFLWSFSAKFRGENPQRNVVFIFLREKNYFAQEVYCGEMRKKSFFLGLICM